MLSTPMFCIPPDFHTQNTLLQPDPAKSLLGPLFGLLLCLLGFLAGRQESVRFHKSKCTENCKFLFEKTQASQRTDLESTDELINQFWQPFFFYCVLTNITPSLQKEHTPEKAERCSQITAYEAASH